MNKRVVITGMGVVAPNGVGKKNFLNAIKKGKSGIKFIPELKELNFGCQIGGIPDIDNSAYNNLLNKYSLSSTSSTIKYAVIAGLEAWKDAGYTIPDYDSKDVDYNKGIIIGSGAGSICFIGSRIVPLVNKGLSKKLRSTTAEYAMHSGSSAALSGILALGNQITANSSACATGTEAIIMGYDRIKSGKAKAMLVGGTEVYSPYSWIGYDVLRVLTRKYNDNPLKASRPMSASANGFVPGAGAGVLIIEDLETALKRNARIYAEITGTHINSGGQRNNGSMTAPNPDGVQRCIKQAIKSAGIKPQKIDYISGHLTSTMADPIEIKNWTKALKREKSDFPYINSLKSMTGHCIGAAGTIETISAVLEMYHNFIYPCINCEDLHPEIAKIIDKNRIPQKIINNIDLNYVAKASFGFGDVNSCLILKKIS
jgi:3-oxoacyl-(acyl-carrier-protein) synthase